MAKVFLIDIAKCCGCYNCQFACKDEHCDNEWEPFSKKQPLIGQFWIKVNETLQGSRPKVRIFYTPTLCNHCDNAACMNSCKQNAIYRREDGLVIIDPAKCNGCKECVSACPYGAVFFNEEYSIAQKCTGCAHLIEAGKQPRCVDVCPTNAIIFAEEDEVKNKIKGASVMKPETAASPRVFYKNIPGQFIAGTIFDPVEEEVIKGALCHLSDGAKVWDVYTDDFGDFWFNDLPVGQYDLYIKADGFKTQYWYGLDTEKCINIGDIAFERA